MIQRIQTIWLLLVAVFAAITFRFPFYSGERVVNTTATTATTTPNTTPPINPVTGLTDLDANTTIWLTILTVLAGAIAFVTIFLFNNRRLQLRLTYLGIFVTVVLLVVYFLEIQNFSNGNIALWCIFYFAILACYILAVQGILKDEKLIKSMDRLR
jgi:hypothetical protein